MKKVMFGLAIIAMLFVSCKEDEVTVKTGSDELVGEISSELLLDASVEYKLTGSLVVVNGGVLRIPAGTVIKAENGFDKYILVEQGGRIYINGTAEKPVRICSGDSLPAAGAWGGLVINGRAKLSGATATGITGTTEIDTESVYGGDDDADNSGEIEFLILEHTGAKSSASVEHNGLTLNGVGSGTIIENIYVKDGSDDGIEFFGGSVSVKNILVVNSDDDMFDATQGWTGTIDNGYGVWEASYTSSEKDPRGLELDGNFDGLNPNDLNQSNVKFKNITIKNKSTFAMQDAIKVRRGTTATITNILIDGLCTDLIDFKDDKGNGSANSTIKYKTSGGASTNIVNPDGATVTEKTDNNGANTSAFSWTGYQF